MTKKILLYVLLGVVVGALGTATLLAGSSANLGVGTVHNTQETFDEGIAVDGTEVISGTGQLTIHGGTQIDKFLCGTATWNPGSVSSTTAETTSVTISGLALNDSVVASFGASLQGLALNAYASTTDTAIVTLFDPDNTGAGVDLATSTVEVCSLQY